MVLEQIYTGCLSQGAYYIESNGEAAVIDPLRETIPYISRANKSGSTIKYVFETHFHADFVSGHVDLAEKTGATIVFGPTGETGFKSHQAYDGEEFKIGELILRVLHTPGHTMESVTYLLIDESGNETAIFSGDTLFIGDVGRPDLAVKSDLTREDLAGHLYDSLQNKIMPLPDHLVVYPAHGAGSACGKNMSSQTSDTLGSQKETNYALRPELSREQFIREVTEGILPPPQYFPKNVQLNKSGYESLDIVKSNGLRGLSPVEFEFLVSDQGALMIDTRGKDDFRNAHIPNSIFIGIEGNFASWVGKLITDIQQPIVFIAEEGREDEVVTRFARVGYDNVLGYLNEGISGWTKAGMETDRLSSVTVDQLEELKKTNDLHILDVRRTGEHDAAHINGSQNFPLDYLNENLSEVSKENEQYIHCKSGYRSLIASSILKARGYKVIDIEGGFDAIEASKVELQETANNKQ